MRADEKRLRQVLLNLLSNAVKFTDRGAGDAAACASRRRRAGCASRCRTPASASSAEQLGRIFQPFEQVGRGAAPSGGTGLGLAISRQFVRLMGGDIQVESRVGARQHLLVRDRGAGGDGRDGRRDLTVLVIGYPGPRKKVLVVDDVAENRAVVVDMLGPLGFEMSEAASGREGLEKARTLRPDLILMDIVMPEMDGLEATRRLRRQPALEEVPIIAVSASTSGRNREDSLAAGMNAFLPKPITLDAAAGTDGRPVEAHLDSRAAGDPSLERDEAGSLVVPAEEEMEILYRLARMGNMQDILQRATYLSELDARYRPFANQLSALAKGYQSKAILRLIERHLASTPDEAR